jgi:hypothetical protein
MSDSEGMVAIAVGIGLASMVIGAVAAAFAGMAWAKVVGLENSTHQIQYVPIDPTTPENTEIQKDADGANYPGYQQFEDEHI